MEKALLQSIGPPGLGFEQASLAHDVDTFYVFPQVHACRGPVEIEPRELAVPHGEVTVPAVWSVGIPGGMVAERRAAPRAAGRDQPGSRSGRMFLCRRCRRRDRPG